MKVFVLKYDGEALGFVYTEGERDCYLENYPGLSSEACEIAKGDLPHMSDYSSGFLDNLMLF